MVWSGVVFGINLLCILLKTNCSTLQQDRHIQSLLSPTELSMGILKSLALKRLNFLIQWNQTI